MEIDAVITRIRQRPGGVLLYFGQHPHKLGIIGCVHLLTVGQRVRASETDALIWDGAEGKAGKFMSYRRDGLRLYPGGENGGV